MTDNKDFLSLWHGGRDLEFNYNIPQKAVKGRWEHGPGLYLTTHYETAKKYAKGGGRTYRVEFDLGNNIRDVWLDIDDVLKFIKENVVKSKQYMVLDDIHSNMKRMNVVDKVEANVLLNLLFNYDAVVGEKTLNLNRFLVESGVDYGVVNRFGGREETVFVIYDLEKIKKVKAINAKDVLVSDFELDVSYLRKDGKLKC